MAPHRVLITPQFLRPGDAVDRLLREHGCETLHRPHNGPWPQEELVELVRDVDAAIVASDRITAEVMDTAPRLRVVARPGAGYDAIDVDAATRRGIAVCNMPGVNRIAVAEMTIALMLMCARHIPENIDDVRSGAWRRIEGRELSGATLGLVGLGAIGKRVATLARAFDMAVIAHDRYQDTAFADRHGITFVTKEELLARADFVSLHVFLDATTRHWIDRAALSLMKPTAYLINTSRGPLVDEAALHEAVRDGAIAGAGLDVVETEPLPESSPLRRLPNVHVTPHLGGVTREARERSGTGAARNVLNVLTGAEPTNVVNPTALKRT